MPTVHNEAKKENIAKTVIMPGDPLRAKYIAENFLDDYKLVNGVRAMYAYTGFYKGKKVSVMAHGMGNASAGIYSYELFKFYDVDNIIRIGSAGTINPDVKIRTVALTRKTYSLSSYAKVLDNDDSNVMESSSYLNDKIIKTAKEKNINLTLLDVYNSDAYYNETENISEIHEKYGCSLIEMETFALFKNAKYLHKNASCILTVSNSLLTKEELSSLDRQNGFNEMIELALDTSLLL